MTGREKRESGTKATYTLWTRRLTRVCDGITLLLAIACVFLKEVITKLILPISVTMTVLYGCVSFFNWKAPKEDRIPISASTLGHPYSGFLFFLIIDILLLVRFCTVGVFL